MKQLSMLYAIEGVQWWHITIPLLSLNRNLLNLLW